MPQLAVTIDGYPEVLTSAQITESLLFGLPNFFYGLPGVVWGGGIPIEAQEFLISLDGTTNTISQQIQLDDSAATSTQQLTIGLVNQDNRLRSLVEANSQSDFLSKQAVVYLGAEGMNFPDDFLRIFIGNITQIKSNGGIIALTVSHPEDRKRSEIYTKVTTELVDDPLPNAATTVNVVSTEGFLPPSLRLRTFIRIDEEIIEYTGLTATSFTGCIRESLNTITPQDVPRDERPGEGDAVESFVIYGDATNASNAVDFTLQVLISGSGPWITGNITNFADGPLPANANSIKTPTLRLRDIFNVQVGDLVTVTGSPNPANNLVSAPILEILQEVDGTRFVVASPLVFEVGSPATFSISSQHDVLALGVGLRPDQVDIDEFTKTKELFGNSLPNYAVYLKDSITAKDLIDKELLLPARAFSIPRKGRVSLTLAKPPIADQRLVKLNETTVLNASSISVQRATTSDFYNSVNYRFQVDSLEDRFLASRIRVSATSLDRIKIGNKPFIIESQGLRVTPENEVVISLNSARLLDRFQFGAEKLLGVQVLFSEGYTIEVGDVVLVEDLQLVDSQVDDVIRGLKPRLFEVVNRRFNFRNGSIILDLLDSAYAADSRFGVISPSSQINQVVNPTRLQLTKSFNVRVEQESEKWRGYEGQNLLIHDPNWTRQEVVELTAIVDGELQLKSPGLVGTYLPGDIIDVAHYDGGASAFLKVQHAYINPTDTIAANALVQNVIKVSDVSLFFVGSLVLVHNLDYSNQSIVTEVLSIDLLNAELTLADDLGYLPLIGDSVELIGFVSDEGIPYRLF